VITSFPIASRSCNADWPPIPHTNAALGSANSSHDNRPSGFRRLHEADLFITGRWLDFRRPGHWLGDAWSWPSFRLVPLESLPRARSSPFSRVRVPGSLTVRGCPAATDGLDGELARLQDQGTGGMAPLAMPRARNWPCGAASVSPVTSGPTRAGRSRGPAAPKSGRPGGRERARVRKVTSQLRTVDAPRPGQRSRRAALLHVRRPGRAARFARP
jgi:hypothetical protein